MAKIALFGATGTIGARVLHEAVGRGHQVTVVVRDPERLGDSADSADVADSAAEVLQGDVLDPHSVAEAAAGQDVVVSAVGPGSEDPGLLVTAAKSLIGGVCTLAQDARPRVLVVGGAGSLRTPAGPLVWEAAGVPEPVRALMHAHGEALDFLRTVPVEEVRWSCLSPAADMAPGERTGTYRLALDDLVADEDGGSRISAEDYAVALVDEIERDAHPGKRFTIGY
ncbi:NAD(P)-dependent oxidoreductase [Streptomyces sp. NPDC086989]|uniref:NAD(P)-dependent oxidoreductase n=1 Tax=Streptomyces sp. NPDC086989 TaxID=3365764 RepID=UPI0037FC5711